LQYLHQAEALSKPGGLAAAALKRYLTQADLKPADKAGLVKEIATGKGSADNGKAVYRRICSSCHKWGAEGIEYGPHMNGVATRLKREEILESVLEPNAKIDPRFVTTNVETKDGGAFTGFIVEETPEVLTLAVAGGIKQDLRIANLRKRETVKQSSMPEGLANAMSPTEFIDLVEFLSSLKK
jgi:putative heme-binding domain-containing protein